MSGILAAMPDAFGQSAPHPTLSGVAADQVVDLDIVVGQFFQDQLQIPGVAKTRTTVRSCSNRAAHRMDRRIDLPSRPSIQNS
jgi:hypothetical protein